MADRVLNFSEFQTKYSEDSEQDAAASLSDFSTAADNFADGFDEASYDDNKIGPNRPVQKGGNTPAQPGEEGAPKFDSTVTSGTEFPENDDNDIDDSKEEEGEEVNPMYGQYSKDDGGNPEEDEEEEEEDEDEEDEEEEEEDENKNESVNWNKSGLLESFEDFSNRGSQPRSRTPYSEIEQEIEIIDFDDNENDHSHDDEDHSCYVICKSCGKSHEIEDGDKPYGSMKTMDSESWWQGSEMGMQCGCNM